MLQQVSNCQSHWDSFRERIITRFSSGGRLMAAELKESGRLLRESISSRRAAVARRIMQLVGVLLTDAFCIAAFYYAVRKNFMVATFIFFRTDQSGNIIGVDLSFDWFNVIAAFLIVGFWMKGIYGNRRPFWGDLRATFAVVLFGALVDGALFLQSRSAISWGLVPLFWGGLAIGLSLMRHFFKIILSTAGVWDIPTILVGVGDNAYEALIAMKNDLSLGFRFDRIIGFPGRPVQDELARLAESLGVPITCEAADAIEDLASQGFHIVLAPQDDEMLSFLPVVDALSLHPNVFDIIPPIRGFPLSGLEVNYKFGSEILIMRPRNNLARWGARALKRAVDIVLAFAMLVILSPLMGWIAWKIWRSGSTPLFRHQRVGRGGKLFYCLKFQSMVPNASQALAELLDRDPDARAEWAETFKLRDDPRVTPLGKFLRKTSLDELPQLLNVLKGEMSLTGPRPIVVDELKFYGTYIPYYYQVAPGITGLWQISGRSDIDYPRRVFLDTWYVKNWSLWYDFVILIKTIMTVLYRSGAY